MVLLFVYIRSVETLFPSNYIWTGLQGKVLSGIFVTKKKKEGKRQYCVPMRALGYLQSERQLETAPLLKFL